jgi:signal transduction histidine kinase
MRLIPVRFNLKQRVMWALTALVALFVIMQGALAYLSMVEQEDDLVDELVLAETRRLATRIGQDEVTGTQAIDLLSLSPHFSGWLVSAAGTASPAPLPDTLRDLPVGPHLLTQGGAELHAYVMQTAEGRLYVQYNAEQHEEKVRQFGYYLVGLGLLCIALAAAVARQIAAVVVAPLERLARLLAEWAPGSMPTDEAEEAGEEERLLAAFRRVQERFEESVAHEREFVANARHEIRTPLTALRTDLEMLALNGDANMQQRLQRAISSVDEIAGALDLAHTLAQRHAQHAETVELASCVDAAWVSLAGVEGIARLGFSNQVGAEVCVLADRHALLTILRNLVRNAAEHAAATHCTVTHTPRGIEIADDGVGIAAHDLPLVFDRYYRGRRLDARGQLSGGERADRGLGLAIARQIADLHGWQLAVESAPGEGTRFILSLSIA